MKTFFFNTKVGVAIILVLIVIISLLITGTLILLIWGGGYLIFDDLITTSVIGLTTFKSALAVWTLLNIVLFICILLCMIVEISNYLDKIYNDEN